MKHGAIVVLAALAAPSAILADTVTGALTLSYTQQDASGSQMDTKGVDGRMKIDLDNGLSFGLDVGKSTMSQDGSPIEISGEYIGLKAGYRFGNGFKAGAFADRLTIGFNLSPIDFSLNTNGMSLGYEGSGFDVEAFVGNTSSNLPLPFDIENRGVTARYTGVQGLDVGGTFLRATLSSGGASEDIDFKGLAATYSFSDAFMVFGGVARSDFFLAGNLDSTGIGVAYDLGPMTGFSSTVSLEVAKTDMGIGTDIDTVRLGLSVPLGKKGPILPMNSVADSILNPRHGAFNAAITSAF
ncbi:MAG: hypothetical protein U1E58_10940 [Tabrizicola sp.]